MKDKEKVREFIRLNYSKVAQSGSTGGCCSGGCSCNGDSIDIKDASLSIGYSEDDLSKVPTEANMGLG